MFCKLIFVFSVIYLESIKAELLILKNTNSRDLIFSVTGQEDIIVAGKDEGSITLDSHWSGTITAIPTNAEIKDGPRTTVELAFGSEYDRYDVSLKNGFNYGAKIVPIGMERYCETVSCFTGLKRICPIENRVSDSQGRVVACKNSPAIMHLVCPRAVVTSSDSYKVKTCNSSTYLVVIG